MTVCVVNSPVAVERRLMMRMRGNLVPAIKQITYSSKNVPYVTNFRGNSSLIQVKLSQ